MAKLDKELEELIELENNVSGFGDPDARKQHHLKIEHLKFKITRRDNLKIAIVSALIGAIVSAIVAFLIQAIG